MKFSVFQDGNNSVKVVITPQCVQERSAIRDIAIYHCVYHVDQCVGNTTITDVAVQGMCQQVSSPTSFGGVAVGATGSNQ